MRTKGTYHKLRGNSFSSVDQAPRHGALSNATDTPHEPELKASIVARFNNSMLQTVKKPYITTQAHIDRQRRKAVEKIVLQQRRIQYLQVQLRAVSHAWFYSRLSG
jgi:hypothetical protein